ncbi:MAG: Peptidase [Homoserinimonas sp.]|nr:Peptidase [Homoserinimonas sp.]
MTCQRESSEAVRAYLENNSSALVGQLREWVSIPSVDGDPVYQHACIRSAHWLAGAFRDAGFPLAEVWQTGETAAVYAEWCAAPGSPTVLVYSHHDVRAVKDEEWDETAPFEPVLHDGRLFGRGASDSKGQVLAHVWGVRAHLARTGAEAPAVNLKFLVEGEEESGSIHLMELLDKRGRQMAADLLIFTDTLQWKADYPAVSTSMRGTITAHLDIFGPERDVHSGAVSGPSPNPVRDLANLLGHLYDDDGRVAIPGFYDAVVEVSDARKAELAHLPFSEEDWLERSGTKYIVGERGYTVLERLWVRPAAEVLTVVAGDPYDVSRAAIPAVASADFSIRTVPDQRVDVVIEQLRSWIEHMLGDAADFELIVPPTAQEAYVTPEHPAVMALERAMQRAYQTEEVGRMGNAGGGPTDLIASKLGVPAVFFGTGLLEDHWHSSNESVRIDVLQSGAATMAYFWEELPAALKD